MLKNWNKNLNRLSGNLTTNEYMPKNLKKILLEEDLSLKKEVNLKEMLFPKLPGILNEIGGLNILAKLQKLRKKNCLTVFRAIRFPTYKRIHEILYNKGYAVANYEQERILEIYKNTQYKKKRETIQKDKNFWTQPQERVVSGLPVFHLINDALQIHYAYRGKKDRVAISVIYIPYSLLKSNTIKLTANAAIDLDFNNDERDTRIKDFILQKEKVDFNFDILTARGINLHEMYANNLPWTIKDSEKLGIKQEHFLLDIYEINNEDKIKKLFRDTETLVKNKYFLHGFFGDQNIFGRRSTRYLPSKCYKISKKSCE